MDFGGFCQSWAMIYVMYAFVFTCDKNPALRSFANAWIPGWQRYGVLALKGTRLRMAT